MDWGKDRRSLAVHFFGGNKAKQSRKCGPAKELVPKVQIKLLGTIMCSPSWQPCWSKVPDLGKDFSSACEGYSSFYSTEMWKDTLLTYSSGQTLSNQRGGMTSTGEHGFPDRARALRLPLARASSFYLCNSSVAAPCRELTSVPALPFCTGLSDRHHCHVYIARLFLLSSLAGKSWSLPALQSRWKTFAEWWLGISFL